MARLTLGIETIVDEILIEWIDSDGKNVRFDAIAVVSDYRISSALPALHRLSARLEGRSTPWGAVRAARRSRG